MNWKLFITACVSACTTLFPENGITCGPTEDPHDYFTSFFSNKTGTEQDLRPFYYTALLKFYDDEDWQAKEDSLYFVNKAVTEEWKVYGKVSSESDVIKLVYFATEAELKTLAEAVQSGKPLPPSFVKNSLAQSLAKEKSEAIAYLHFAKRTEDVSTTGEWEDRSRDSIKLNGFVREATDAYGKTTDAFLKNKYSFQRCKVLFYNNRYEDCIRWYDEHFTDDNSSAVAELALSYKGGSLFRLGRNKEAAYAFSKAFVRSVHNKRGHFTGFLWATDYAKESLLQDYLSLCKNNAEKAVMTALFAMYGTDYRLDAVQKVYELNSSSPLLPLLVTREIAKLEEQYFTPMLEKEKGGKSLYISWGSMDEKDKMEGKVRPHGRQQAANAAQLFERIMNDNAVPHRGLYGAGAAYLRFMNRDYEGARNVLAKKEEWGSDEKLKAQTQLIQLLIAANEAKTLSKEKEAQLLSSLKWLVQKANEDRDYQLFCRNFFSQILAQQYQQQGDMVKAALAYGIADLPFIKRGEEEYFYSYPPAIDFVREDLTTENLLKLYEVMSVPGTAAEKFFVQTASFKKDNVIDAIGTSYLRDRDYAKAIEWFSKAGKLEPLVETQYNYKTGQEKMVNVDPLHDYLNDWQRLSKAAATPYNKLTLAKKLLELETKIKAGTPGEDKSRLFYQYASMLYNMSHYGNSWNALTYHRSSTSWNYGSHKLPWENEYYGVYTAREYYQKAYDATTNKEFKAACLFMVAKCAQRQIPRPSFDYNNYPAYEKAEAAFQQKFKNNPLFRQFKSEFGTTKFYQYAFNRCSYLRDYVKQSTAPAKARVKSRRKQ